MTYNFYMKILVFKNMILTLFQKKYKEILQNTINIFKQEFKILKDLEEYDEYEKYLQDNIEKHSGKKPLRARVNMKIFLLILLLSR